MRAYLAGLLALSLSAHAELKPEWELGAGATAFTLPDYRGSDESRAYLLPIPYFVYRGERLRVDRQGARGMLFESDRFELDLSLSAAPPVDSSENRARQGMPDLDTTVEIGPRLNLILMRDRPAERALTLRLPLRAVVATDLSHANGAGWVFYPNLSYDARPVLFGAKWNLGLQAGLLYGSREYHQYFYGVEPQFATPERPAYEARSGYSGAAFGGSLTRRIGKWWVAGFARYESLKGAVFEGSPLARQDYALTAGVAFAWVFKESSRQVEVDVED
jgi:MipA family protein